MATDTDNPLRQSDYIARRYAEAAPKERELLDDVFAALCGWKLGTILAGQDRIDGDDEREEH